MPAPESIQRLINQFKTNLKSYKSPAYNEAQLRQEFLNPFFEALGWDVANKQGFAMQYRDVVHEDSLEFEDSRKAPDYAFRIGGVRKFFVEAKKPAGNIKTDAGFAYQLRRYAWNAHLPLSILTDFEDFAVYDCRNKPLPGDGAATSRLMLIHYEDYPQRWDEISAIFTKEAILKGAFDRYVEGSAGKRGTIKVDDAFLADIEDWRVLLARNLALRNPAMMDERQLNFAVQMTIDRIIFLRICEDRGIEPENQLLEIGQSTDIYANLMALFYRADLRYNSGLFHFQSETRLDQTHDTLTPRLNLDDGVLKGIIKDLYYPSPYIFNEIPVEILGQVYEQFLGKVIRLTASHRAKVEEKPEVRKAGGVYYTPKYIVDAIVSQTVGSLLLGKTPEEVTQIKIVDPACGSGSFLLGAYQYLLDWHENWYLSHTPQKWAKALDDPLAPAEDGGWRLSTAEKKRILVNNIFGVDIDAQAVEVTKLSLLLKVLEGYTGQMRLGFERALPDLGQNIQCGNSLIDSEFYFGRQLNLFDEEERYRINAFDWERAFPQVFGQGGFDAVIGNPPYIRIQAMQEWAPVEAEYYKEKYISASQGNYDIYVVFIEKGLDILNATGRLGFIVPHKFFNAQFGKPIRKLLADGGHLQKIVHFGSQQVFENATTYTCLLFLNKAPQKEISFIVVDDLTAPEATLNAIWQDDAKGPFQKFAVPAASIDESAWVFHSQETARVMERLAKQPRTLGDITRKIFQGIATSADKIYVLQVVAESEGYIRCFSRSLNKEVTIERGLLKPFLMGKEVHRYQPLAPESMVIFPYLIQSDNFELMSSAYLKNNYPNGWKYLFENKEALSAREKGRYRGDSFYVFSRPQNMVEFENRKIVTPDIAYGSQFSIDLLGQYYHTTTVYSFVFTKEYSDMSLYFLGILNCKLFWFFIKNTGNVLRGGYFRFKTKYLEPFPIRMIDFEDPLDIESHQRMVSLVERMLDLNARLSLALTPHEQIQLQRQIDATDAEIDSLVYALYELSPEEIRIVEENVS